jgi:gliding motility-associated lipoprotein GldD
MKEGFLADEPRYFTFTRMKNKIALVIIVLFSFLFISCHDDDYAPKPRGFFRIALPEKNYVKFNPADCPFEFEIPVYAKVSIDSSKAALPCWLNLELPYFKATVYLTYKEMKGDLQKLYEDHRSMTMRHIAKASAIDETAYHNEDRKVYGSVYTVKGAAASNMQFYLTDSLRHFIRGSLYFYSAPQPDSIAPSLNFVSADLKHLIETFQWK